jgi:epoxyqueuosine reductase
MSALPHSDATPARDGLLLHACCAPCSTVAVPYWRAEGLEPEAFFFNPNIQPASEHSRRQAAMRSYAAAVDLPVRAADSSTVEEWGRDVGGEWLRGGTVSNGAEERCRACVALRLRETAWEAVARGLTRFTTTLTLSPYQRHDHIVQAGLRAADEAGAEFLYADLRRHYRRSIDESRRRGLYRQKYCGCVASKWDAWFEGAARRRRRRAA